MAIYITQIDKHKFVCGLFWQSLSRPRELVKEATDLARKIDSDLMILRMDQSTAQAGFAQSREGARRGMFSLGAVVSKTLALEGAYYDGEQQPVHNWLGAFKLPDGKWAYFAVRDANFLPNGDFAGTKEEVLERLHGDYGLGGWNVVIGDDELADYGFHNFNAKRIETLLPHRKDGSIRTHRWWGLRQLHAKKPWWPFAVGAAVAVAVGGAALWQQYQRKQEELERERAIEAARQKMLGNAGPSALPPPWGGKPLPTLSAQACVDQLSYMTPGGWQLDDYTCYADRVTYTWSRHHSTVAYLLAQVPGASVDLSGNKATYSERLNLGQAKAEALLGSKELLEPIISKLQLMGIAPKITQLQTQGNGGNGVPAPEWQEFSFALNTRGLPPVTIAALLEQPGVRIDKLTYRGGEWSIDGVMYAK